ncbi:MAG: trehalose-phosphatase [Thermoguttaceae bacterium]|jgi:trehalose-phosphatase|nr:trehalose-phosphatase [Thermoguttaceae bacterium]
MTDLSGVIERCVLARASGRRLLLLFDYDGTLVPIVDRPSRAKLPWATRRLLGRLARRPGVTLGIFSGRALDDLLRMCGLEGIWYAGTSGLELQYQQARTLHPLARPSQATVASLAERLAAVAAAYRGAWIEDKQFALTLHYRQTPPKEVPRLLAEVEAAAAPFFPDVRIVEGPMALEISPELHWDKGSTVRLLAERFREDDPLVLYAGDGANDREALRTATALQGIALGVGPDAEALLRVPDPRALVRFLGRLDALLEHPGRPSRAKSNDDCMARYGLWQPAFPAIRP